MKAITYKAMNADGTGWVFGTPILHNERNYILTGISEVNANQITVESCVEVIPESLKLIVIKDKQKSDMTIKNEKNIEEIISRVCAITGLSIDEIRSRSRKTELVSARQVIQWLICEDMARCKVYLDFTKIGMAVNKHRTSVYPSIRRVNDAIQTNDKFIVGILNAYNQHKQAA